MLPDWENLLKELKEDIRRNQAQPEPVYAEYNFRLALRYWHHLQKSFCARVMYIDSEEIEFFKNVKPRFTSYIEYYLIVNQSLLFIPDDNSEKMIYWLDQEKKYSQLYERQRSFIDWYNSGMADRDARYFLQRNNHEIIPAKEKIYEDEECRSSHDHLVRRMLANRMYRDYVEEKLNALEQIR